MPRGGAHFNSEELVRVMSHYDVGVILRIKPLTGGNRNAPKMVVVSEKGKYLLKRRPRGKDDLYRVAFAHAAQSHLAGENFPVTGLVPTYDENNTILQLDNHIYELFKFITGVRYNGSPEATEDAGRRLAEFHHLLTDFAHDWQPLKSTFHDSATVRSHLKTISSDKMTEPNGKLRGIAEALTFLYNDSSIRVSQLGFDSWGRQIVHGDWHPGNMLFADDKVVAVLDFDSLRIAAPVTDLANGMLQFSIVAGSSNPADWPDRFDKDKLKQLLNGYRGVAQLDVDTLESLVDLMIETMIAEAVLPVAVTGFFGHHHGTDFLQMIRRKAEWLKENREKLTELIRD